MLVPVNLTGGDYQHKSRPLTNQHTRNFWPQAQQTQKALSQYILTTFYGLKTFKTQAGGVDRGMLVNQGKLYKVSGTTLYQVTSDGTHTSLGTVPGSNRCVLSAMGSQVIVVNGSGLVYLWNDPTFSQITDSDLGSPRGVAVLNNQAIYDAGSGQGFDVSDVGTPDVINGLNNAQAESSSDALLIPYAFRETLYLFGTETVELWWNSGQGNPPFDKIQGAVIDTGLEAINSVAHTTDFIFFLGNDRQIHSLTAGSSSVDTIVSTPALAKIFQDYTTVDDAIGWTMQLEGQWFYVITLPTEDVTWVYPIGGEAFEWGSSLTGRIRANSYAYIFGKHLVGDYQSANIYELSASTYTDAGEEIVRTRDSAPIHGGLFKQDGKEFEVNELQIVLETGIGLVSGQGIDPRIAVSFSNDGGKTFGTERFVKVGASGDYSRRKVILKNCGRFSTCVIRLRVSDPVAWNIYSAAADIEICI
jgi:hypothetical protein